MLLLMKSVTDAHSLPCFDAACTFRMFESLSEFSWIAPIPAALLSFQTRSPPTESPDSIGEFASAIQRRCSLELENNEMPLGLACSCLQAMIEPLFRQETDCVRGISVEYFRDVPFFKSTGRE